MHPVFKSAGWDDSKGRVYCGRAAVGSDSVVSGDSFSGPYLAVGPFKTGLALAVAVAAVHYGRAAIFAYHAAAGVVAGGEIENTGKNKQGEEEFFHVC